MFEEFVVSPSLYFTDEIGKLNPSARAPIEVFKFVEELNLSKAEIFDCVLAVSAKENSIDSFSDALVYATARHYKVSSTLAKMA